MQQQTWNKFAFSYFRYDFQKNYAIDNVENIFIFNLTQSSKMKQIPIKHSINTDFSLFMSAPAHIDSFSESLSPSFFLLSLSYAFAITRRRDNMAFQWKYQRVENYRIQKGDRWITHTSIRTNMMRRVLRKCLLHPSQGASVADKACWNVQILI